MAHNSNGNQLPKTEMQMDPPVEGTVRDAIYIQVIPCTPHIVLTCYLTYCWLQLLKKSRASMSTALAADLDSGTVDALLSEVDSKSKKAENTPKGDVAIGPFGILKFDICTKKNSNHQNDPSEKTSPTLGPNRLPYDEVIELDSLLSSVTDPLPGADEFLHWADLFGLGSDLIPGISSDELDHGELTVCIIPFIGVDVALCLNRHMINPYRHLREMKSSVVWGQWHPSWRLSIWYLLRAMF
jgi:hypothetical protein